MSMAASRVPVKCLFRHLGRDAAGSKGLSRILSRFYNTKPTEVGRNFTTCAVLNFNAGAGGLCLRPALFDRRHFRSGVHEHQQSQLEADIAASDPAPGFQQPIPMPLRNYSPVLAGFSVLPNPAAGVSAGLTQPSNAGNLSLEQLGREMSNSLGQGRLEECVRLFEDWLKFPDLQGKAKVPSVMTYNLLLHAKLRQGVDPRNMQQAIKEMEMSRLKPNLLSYNFLLRAIFRQRDSKMAEETLERMEQSGTEAQPDGDSYNFVIVLCALDRRVDAAMARLQAMLQRGYIPSRTTYNELLLAATKDHRSDVAKTLMKDIKRLNITPQPQAVIELAMAAAEVDDSECAILALKVLTNSELSKPVKNLNMDEGGMHYLLSSAARVADVSFSNEAWSILCNTLKDIKHPNASSYLARIHALASAGDFDSAFATLREAETIFGNTQTDADREIFSPFSSLRPLVLACTSGGPAALDAAYYKLAEMQSSGQPVTLSAINCVIQGCANAWDFDRAYQTFETIGTTFGLMPNVHSCNSLLDVFGKSRKTAEVVQIFNYMHEVGVVPDERTYSLLVGAHVVNRDPKAALDALAAMTNAGHVPQRQTLAQIWRRCIKESYKEGVQEVDKMMKELGYRDTQTALDKWNQIAFL